MSAVDLNEPVVRGWGDARSKSVNPRRVPPDDLALA
jgi:hypothetical protein